VIEIEIEIKIEIEIAARSDGGGSVPTVTTAAIEGVDATRATAARRRPATTVAADALTTGGRCQKN